MTDGASAPATDGSKPEAVRSVTAMFRVVFPSADLSVSEAPSQSSAVSWLPYAVLRGYLKLTSGETTETVKLPDRSSVPLR